MSSTIDEIKLLKRPEGLKEHHENICSNFDHVINESAVEELKKGISFAAYPGWDFYATVWYANGLFHAKIKQYQVHVDTISAKTFAKVKKLICKTFGND